MGVHGCICTLTKYCKPCHIHVPHTLIIIFYTKCVSDAHGPNLRPWPLTWEQITVSTAAAKDDTQVMETVTSLSKQHPMDAEQFSMNVYPMRGIVPFLRSYSVLCITFAETSDGVQSKNSLLALKELGAVYVNWASLQSAVGSVLKPVKRDLPQGSEGPVSSWETNSCLADPTPSLGAPVRVLIAC